jgi:hypothetical protein
MKSRRYLGINSELLSTGRGIPEVAGHGFCHYINRVLIIEILNSVQEILKEADI